MLPRKKTSEEVFGSGLYLLNLTARQVETFFGELEYIAPRLKTLGIKWRYIKVHN